MKKVDFIDRNGTYIIQPHGEMTFFFLEELDEFIKEKISKNEYKFIYDLSDVKWIDSMGLGLVAMTVKIALLNNSRVCVVQPRENVVELLRLSSLIDLILIYDEIDEALAFFK
jgi:anti-anti-sigma factor